MQVFAIFEVSNPPLVEENLNKLYADQWYRVSSNAFFVATEGETTRQVADSLGFSDDNPSLSGIVVPVYSYWGRSRPDLWEWLAIKMS